MRKNFLIHFNENKKPKTRWQMPTGRFTQVYNLGDDYFLGLADM